MIIVSKAINEINADLLRLIKRPEDEPAPPITIDEWAKGCSDAFPLWAEPLKKFMEEQDKKS